MNESLRIQQHKDPSYPFNYSYFQQRWFTFPAVSQVLWMNIWTDHVKQGLLPPNLNAEMIRVFLFVLD